MPMLRLNGVGLTKRCRCAYSQPDTAASSAASTNSLMRWLAVSTPIDSAIRRPVLSARMARPSRESSRLCSAQMASSSTAQMTMPSMRGEASEMPKISSGGKLLMPVKPPSACRLPKM